MSLGESALGVLVGAALLPAPAGPLVAVAPTSGEQDVIAPWMAPSRAFTRPARQEALASAFAEVRDAPSDGVPLTAPFAAARPQRLANPPREHGPAAIPLLALRAEEGNGTPQPRVATPALGASLSHTDDTTLALLASLYQPEAPARAARATPTQNAQVKAAVGKLPISFEQNVGQTDAQVHFFTRGPGYGLFLTGTEAVMVLQQESGVRGQESGVSNAFASLAPSASEEPATPPAVVRMQFVGANATPTVTGRAELPGKVNYFLGNDPAQWHTNVTTFALVQYDDVYPGIDLVYYGNNQQLEYDFVVSPGADPTQIRLRFAHAESLEIDSVGDLVVTAGGQQLRQHKPFVYQEVGNERQEVASCFVLEDVASGIASAPRVQQVRFDVAAYDASRPLVIDPVLSYSTYLGGSGRDDVAGVALDPTTGETLVTGTTVSIDFPTASPFQPVHGGGTQDVYVARLAADGASLVYSTYLGGSGWDYGYGITVDPATGAAVLTGQTTSTNFPTANPYQASFRGNVDAFVTRLTANGAALDFSTYLGGTGEDRAYGLTLDSATGDTLLTGYTRSDNFPTLTPVQGSNRGFGDAFVTRLRADGRALIYSTYLGGNDPDSGYAVALNPNTGDALVTGATTSSNFLTANPFQATNRGGDAFVTRFRADGRALIYSTHFGGDGYDYGSNIAVDPATGDAVFTGQTYSTDFPTVNALQPANRGNGDAFVTRLRANGQALVYSTYFGGSAPDYGWGLSVDPALGDVYLTGATASTDFPTSNPVQATFGGLTDAYVARLRGDGAALVYATYLGGSGADTGFGIAVDRATGDALVAGETLSTNFPTAQPFQPTNRGNGDGFVTRLGSPPVALYYVYPDSGTVSAGAPLDSYLFALDAQLNLIPDYAGLVLFYATDPLASTPVYHQFQRSERGFAAFPGGLTFNTPGVQELYVFDWPGIQAFGYAAFDVR